MRLSTTKSAVEAHSYVCTVFGWQLLAQSKVGRASSDKNKHTGSMATCPPPNTRKSLQRETRIKFFHSVRSETAISCWNGTIKIDSCGKAVARRVEGLTMGWHSWAVEQNRNGNDEWGIVLHYYPRVHQSPTADLAKLMKEQTGVQLSGILGMLKINQWHKPQPHERSLRKQIVSVYILCN